VYVQSFEIRYILDAGSQFVVIFKIIISIIVVPNVLLNLYIMAFGVVKDGGTNKDI